MIGKRIAELRNQKGLTQEEFAKILGVSRSALSLWEQGRRKVDQDVLPEIANYFDVKIDLLFGRVDSPVAELVTEKKQSPADLAGEKSGTIITESLAVDNALASISENSILQDRLRILREENRLTRAEMSEKLRLPHDQLCNWENGRGEPGSEMLKRISDTFDVSVDWLVGKSDLRSPRPTTIALSRSDDPDSDLPDEALKQIEDFRAFIRQKYKNPD